ncbi:MAG: Ppx/GppA phosphatase family protein [Acetobacterales bacterium]
MHIKTRASPHSTAGQAARPATYAALDLGTNNCRLLVAQPCGQGFEVVDSFSRIVRLGEGLARSGQLDEEAIQRALSALHVCSGKLRRHLPRTLRAVATEACRRARNGSLFLDRVRRETGLDIEVITPREEAELAVEGCIALLDPAVPHALVIDIGGGSTEVMWLSMGTGPTPELVDSLSLPTGVNTLTDLHGSDPCAEAYDGIRRGLVDALEAFEARHAIRGRIGAGGVQMVGTSGTVTTLAAAHLDLPRYTRDRIDGTRLSLDAALAVCRRFLDLGDAGRRAHPCIGPVRGAFVMAGCAIFEAVCETWPVASFTVADRGLREGMLLRMMGIRPRYGAR